MIEESVIDHSNDDLTVYEHPLTEKTRSLLRLEFLLAEALQSQKISGEWPRRHALGCLLDITTILARTDFKGDLAKELERYRNRLNALKSHDGVDRRVLDKTESDIRDALSAMRQAQSAGASIRDSEFLAMLRQRSSIPGGACGFDLPALQHWLARPVKTQIQDIDSWFADLLPLQNAIRLTLQLLRGSAEMTTEHAMNGLFSSNLDKVRSAQLLRISFYKTLQCYPEISGGRHRVTIRFVRQPNARSRPVQITESVRFELARCGL